MVYLIHFSEPLKHARHYIGYCGKGKLKARIERHKSGNGAKLLRAVMLAGIEFEVVKTWPEGDRELERKLKMEHNSKRHYKICKPCGK